MRECEMCGKSLVRRNAQARFCSTRCRVAAHRRPIPRELIALDRWVRRTADKRPITPAGAAASSTDPATWSSYRDAAASDAGTGLGFVLGNGIGCLDLDHCLRDGAPTAAAARLLERYSEHHIEISPSGDGLHVWGLREEGPGTRRVVDGVSVETYSVGRYMTVTGRIYQRGQLLPL